MTDNLQAKRFTIAASISCFALAIAIALIQNLRPSNLQIAMVFDSGSYTMTTKYLLDAVRNLLHGMPFQTAIQPVKDFIMLDGPVLPSIGAVFFALAGKEPSIIDLRAPIVLQSIIHATSATILSLAGWRLTGKRKLGFCAGFIFAVWPPEVIGAGRFLTEALTTLFLGSIVLASSYLPKQNEESKSLTVSATASAILGCITALIFLTKAALAPAALLTIGSVFSVLMIAKADKRSVAIAVATAAIFASIILTPWLIFTKAATGEFSLTSKRMPTFNMASGLNPETDGWGALPETPMVQMFSENDGAGAVASAMYRENPGQFYGRIARKPARLFQFPWNDFKINFLGLPPAVQVVAHQIMFVLGLFGIIAFVASPLNLGKEGDEDGSENTEISVSLAGLACVSIIAGHLAYLPFLSDARYGFTATPCLILMGVWCIARLIRKKSKRSAFIKLARLAIAASFIMLAFSLRDYVWRSYFATSAGEIFANSLALGALLLFIACLLAVRTLLGQSNTNVASKVLALIVPYLTLTIVLGASLAGKDIPYDWETRLSEKVTLWRSVKLPTFAKNQMETALVLINLKGDWRAARLQVNGHEIMDSPTSISQFTVAPNLVNDYRTFSWILKSDTSVFEQWRVFRIPVEFLRAGSENILAVTASNTTHGHLSLTGSCISGGNLFNTGKQHKRFYGPTVNIFSPTKLCNSPYSTDPRLKEELPDSIIEGISARKDSSGNTSGTTSTVSKDLSEAPGIQQGQYHMFLLINSKPENSQDSSSNQTVSSSDSIYSDFVENKKKQHASGKKKKDSLVPANTYFANAPIAETVLKMPRINLTVEGDVESVGALNVVWHLNDLRLLQAPIELASFPPNIAGTGRRHFILHAMARTDVVDPKSAQSMIKISSDQVPLSVSNLRLKVEPQAAPALTISDKRWF